MAASGIRTLNASPYASGASESASVVSFTLNEPADDVTIFRDGISSSLGALPAGAGSFALDSASAWSIVATRSATPGYTTMTGYAPAPTDPAPGAVNQISDDSNALLSFFRPRAGLAVNTLPSTGALFGRIYVASVDAGTTSSPGFPTRATGDGIYALNADGSDALGQGNTARTAGLNFSTGGSSSPWRLAVGADGSLFIADWSDPTGSVYHATADIAGGQNVLAGQGADHVIQPTATLNHGSVAGLAVAGTEGTDLTLWTIDEDMGQTDESGNASQLNSLWRYDVGASALPHTGIPTRLTSQLVEDAKFGGINADLARGPDGKFYLSELRKIDDKPALVVMSGDGMTKLFDSRAASKELLGSPASPDELMGTFSIDVSRDGKWLACFRDSNDVVVVPLIDGIPDLPNRRLIAAFDASTGSRGEVAFDAADNLYVISGTSQAMRIFSPGGFSQTILRSDGTFVLKNEPEWIADSDGSWSSAANWLGGAVPSGIGATALLGSAITSPRTITLDEPTTLANLTFDSNSGYTLAGATLTLDSYGEPRVHVLSGSHSIMAPVVLNGNTGFIVSSPSSVLSISNLQASPAYSIIKSGPGTLVANHFRAQSLIIAGGTARIIPGGGEAANSRVTALKIAGDMNAWQGMLDLADSAMIIDYLGGESPIDVVQNQIASGRNGGAWNGAAGITSALASMRAGSAHPTAVGLAEASDIGAPEVFAGEEIDADTLLLRYTLAGDANLDLSVDTVDFNLLVSGFGGDTPSWSNGDFNYDGSVDTIDFNILAGNFGQTLEEPSLGTQIPEPRATVLIGTIIVAIAMRRFRTALKQSIALNQC